MLTLACTCREAAQDPKHAHKQRQGLHSIDQPPGCTGIADRVLLCRAAALRPMCTHCQAILPRPDDGRRCIGLPPAVLLALLCGCSRLWGPPFGPLNQSCVGGHALTAGVWSSSIGRLKGISCRLLLRLGWGLGLDLQWSMTSLQPCFRNTSGGYQTCDPGHTSAAARVWTLGTWCRLLTAAASLRWAVCSFQWATKRSTTSTRDCNCTGTHRAGNALPNECRGPAGSQASWPANQARLRTLQAPVSGHPPTLCHSWPSIGPRSLRQSHS